MTRIVANRPASPASPTDVATVNRDGPATGSLEATLDDPRLGVADGYDGSASSPSPALPDTPGGHAGYAPLPGPPSADTAVRAMWQAARDQLQQLGVRHPPGPRDRCAYPPPADATPLPDPVQQACQRLLGNARQYLDSAGVATTLDVQRGELVVEPDPSSALGRYASFLRRSVGERLVFNPGVLWRDRATGGHNIPARTVFLSTAALDALGPTQTERHEWLHAVFSDQLERQGAPVLFSGFLNPFPGFILFGPDRAYRQGFSVDELACAAYDVFDTTRPLGALRRRLQTGDVRATAELRSALATLAWQQDVQAGPQLAAKLIELAGNARRNLAAQPAFSVERGHSYKFDRSVLHLRQQLGLGPTDPQPYGVELTTRRLQGRDQEVVQLRLADIHCGMDLTFTILDPQALATVQRYHGDLSDRQCLDDLNALVQRFVPARLQAFEQLGQSYRDADATLRLARQRCETLLDQGADAATLAPAVLAVQQAARALRAIVVTGQGEAEPSG